MHSRCKNTHKKTNKYINHSHKYHNIVYDLRELFSGLTAAAITDIFQRACSLMVIT